MNSERRIVEKEIHRFALNDKLMVNCQWLIVMPGYPNANFANGRKLTRITVFVIPNAPFVIPNAVRNLAGKRKEILRLRSE